MMKFVCALTKEYGIKTVASMNTVMIDGTGMCGGCLLSVGGKTVFACVDSQATAAAHTCAVYHNRVH